MAHNSEWQRHEISARIQEVLEAAKESGTQRVIDADGRFDVTFVPKKRTLEELFSKPGPIPDDGDFKP